MFQSKTLLLAGASCLVLISSGVAGLAADLPVKAPRLRSAAVESPPLWTWFLEGGASRLVGDPNILGMNNPPFDPMPKRWGWQGAVGVDYRFAGSPWHVSSQFRYTSNKPDPQTSAPIAVFGGGFVLSTGTNSGERKEHNWALDFMVGRDLGVGMPQLKLGVRVAEIWGQTTGVAQWPLPATATQTRNYSQTNRFLGFGPRGAIDGSMPLVGALSLDYNGGVAALWGRRTVDQSVAVTGTFGGGGLVCTSGCPIAGSDSSSGIVLNADVQAGLGYAITSNTKFSLNYRYEAYWKAMRGWDANGVAVNLDRAYHGPTVKLQMQF